MYISKISHPYICNEAAIASGGYANTDLWSKFTY